MSKITKLIVTIKKNNDNKILLGLNNNNPLHSIDIGNYLNIHKDNKLYIKSENYYNEDYQLGFKIYLGDDYFTKILLDTGYLRRRLLISSSIKLDLINEDLYFNLYVDGRIILDNDILSSLGSKTYSSGWLGTGWLLRQYNLLLDGLTFKRSALTIDNLTVRGTMSVYLLLIQQIRATNGNVFISSSGKIRLVEKLFSELLNKYIYKFKVLNPKSDGNGYGYPPFYYGDIILCQRFDLDELSNSASTVKKYYLVINLDSYLVTAISLVLSDDILINDLFVRIANKCDSSDIHILLNQLKRRGSVYLTADDLEAPYIDVRGDVTSLDKWYNIESLKVRLGNLKGITDSLAGLTPLTNDTYGLYSDSVFLSGHIHAKTGKIGGFHLNDNNLWSGNNDLLKGNIVLSSSNGKITLGLFANSLNVYSDKGIYLDKEGNFNFAKDDNNYIRKDDNNFLIKILRLNIDSLNLKLNSIDLFISIGNNIGYLIGSGIWIGKDLNLYKLFIGLLDGNQIVYDGKDIYVTGKITAQSGNIGGWLITLNSLYNDNILLNSLNSYIGIGTSTYDSNGIFIGKDNDINKLSIKSDNNSLTFDGNDLVITGLINSLSGIIGGWNIDYESIYNNNVYIKSSNGDYWEDINSIPEPNLLLYPNLVIGNDIKQLHLELDFTNSTKTFQVGLFMIIDLPNSYIKLDKTLSQKNKLGINFKYNIGDLGFSSDNRTKLRVRLVTFQKDVDNNIKNIKYTPLRISNMLLSLNLNIGFLYNVNYYDYPNRDLYIYFRLLIFYPLQQIDVENQLIYEIS